MSGRELFSALRARFRRAREIDGLVDSMHRMDARICRANLVTKDGEPVVVLIGLADRAADLAAAYDALDATPILTTKFDPPVWLGMAE